MSRTKVIDSRNRNDRHCLEILENNNKKITLECLAMQLHLCEDNFTVMLSEKEILLVIRLKQATFRLVPF